MVSPPDLCNKHEEYNMYVFKFLESVTVVFIITVVFISLGTIAEKIFFGEKEENNNYQSAQTEKKPEIKNEVAKEVKKQPSATEPSQNYVNSDPPVHCRMSAECGGGTTPLKQSECNNSTCCQINGKWVFYKDKNQCSVDQGQKTNSNISLPNSNTTGLNQIKIHCDYKDSNYNYDFGEITYTECQVKTTEYWNQQRQLLNQNTTTTTLTSKTEADIQKCKDSVRSKYNNLISGCYVLYQDTTANACARGYQEQSSNEVKNCEF